MRDEVRKLGRGQIMEVCVYYIKKFSCYFLCGFDIQFEICYYL